MKKKFVSLLSVGLFSAALWSCSEKKVGNNELSNQEKEEGWTLLFDGKTTDGWHLYNKGKVASSWAAKNGELACNTDTTGIEHGDLVSDKVYKNFDLKFEWKLSKAGNSGVFVNVVEQDTIPTAWASGPEYQLLEHENIGADYLKDSTKWSACLYGFAPQKNKATLKPFGEWNESNIKQNNGKIEFYLNGVLTAEQDLSADTWKNMISKSNFKYFPLFGKNTSGRIALQEWSKGVAFRNIKVKEL